MGNLSPESSETDLSVPDGEGINGGLPELADSSAYGPRTVPPPAYLSTRLTCSI